MQGIRLWSTNRQVVPFAVPCDIKINVALVFITTCLGGDDSPWNYLSCLASGVIFITMERVLSVSNGHLVLDFYTISEASIVVEPALYPHLPPLRIMYLPLSKVSETRYLFRRSHPGGSGSRSSRAYFLSGKYTLRSLHIGLRYSIMLS